MTTGRPVDGPVRLTAEEAGLCVSMGSQRCSPQEYAREKARMLDLKRRGVIQ